VPKCSRSRNLGLVVTIQRSGRLLKMTRPTANIVTVPFSLGVDRDCRIVWQYIQSEPAFARTGPWAYNCVSPFPSLPFSLCPPFLSSFLVPSLYPLSFLPFYPFPFSCPFPDLPQIQLWGLPQPKLNFVHFRRKIWHLVRTIFNKICEKNFGRKFLIWGTQIT